MTDTVLPSVRDDRGGAWRYLTREREEHSQRLRQTHISVRCVGSDRRRAILQDLAPRHTDRGEVGHRFSHACERAFHISPDWAAPIGP